MPTQYTFTRMPRNNEHQFAPSETEPTEPKKKIDTVDVSQHLKKELPSATLNRVEANSETSEVFVWFESALSVSDENRLRGLMRTFE